MPQRSLVMLVLGVVIALGTAWSLRSRAAGEHKAVPTTQVLVAAADIPAGSFVRSDVHVAMVDWPKENITPVMLTNSTIKAADFNGAVARRAIARGETITANALVRSSEGGFMSAVLEPGKRAISIAVDATTGNAGFIFPGDHVDLILTHVFRKGADGSTPQRASETFIQDARVLAVDQSLDNPENKAVLAKTVTLEVTPKQAEEINVAKDLGKIALSLRSLAAKPFTAELGAPAPAPAPSAAGASTSRSINTLDDVLEQNIAAENRTLAAAQPSPAESHVTRDTDVSKVITPDNAAGARVMVIRGSERSEVVFGTAQAEAAHVPQ